MNPCGRAMDTRQHYRAYSVPCRFFKDRPDLITYIRWYTVPNDRPFMPFPTQFMSRRWERQLPQTPLGELIQGFSHARDYPPPGVTGAGFCGTADQWLNGCLSTDPLPPINPANGLPVCCASNVQVGFGGEAEGGPAEGPSGICSYPLPVALTFFPEFFGTPRLIDAIGFHLLWNGVAYQPVESVPLATGGNIRDLVFQYLPDFGLWTFVNDALSVGGLTFLSCALHAFDPFDFRRVPPPDYPNIVMHVFFGWWPFAVATGGEAEGGRGWVLFPDYALGTGGEAEGGEGLVIRAYLGTGGEAEGGDGFAGQVQLGRGGEAEGGRGFAQVATRGTGGEAEGGRGFPTKLERGTGGEAEGGRGFPRLVQLGTGGEAEGGTGSP
jgi:hypothetical protein